MIYVVSGYMRCGTSVMMEALQAGAPFLSEEVIVAVAPASGFPFDQSEAFSFLGGLDFFVGEDVDGDRAVVVGDHLDNVLHALPLYSVR